jgi:hypothetical protein
MGGGNGLIALISGGSCNFSNLRSISANECFLCSPFGLS